MTNVSVDPRVARGAGPRAGRVRRARARLLGRHRREAEQRERAGAAARGLHQRGALRGLLSTCI
eukprot:1571456-Pleurochrysis_carterae.AAC.3